MSTEGERTRPAAGAPARDRMSFTMPRMDRRQFLALSGAALAGPAELRRPLVEPPAPGESEFLVGVEYYRAPMPPQTFWDADFAAIRRSGMRIVRTFSFWNWIEPRPGAFELDDFDRFFELARKHDLRVWFDLTLATHGAAPEWMMRLHPDMRVVSSDGQTVLGVAGNAAPQGKQHHCYDHPKWQEYAERFLRHVVGRYRSDPSLLLWNAWDGVATAAAHAGFPLGCYCGHSIAAYREWLRKNFGLDRLNERLHRRYRDWADVHPPRSTAAIVETLLWREFQYQDLKARLRWQVELVKSLDGSHEVRAHGAHYPRYWDEMCSEEVDSWGFSAPTSGVLTSDDPYRASYVFFAADWSRSIGRQGRWWYEEIYAGMNPGSMTYKKQTSPEEISLNVWAAFARGARGALFWQYRPEYLSFEGPGLNLVAASGAPLPRFEAARRTIREIGLLADLLPLSVPEAEVAVVYHAPSDLLFELGNGADESRAAIQGIYRAFWAHNVPVDVIGARADWKRYKLVWLPSTVLLDEPLLAKLRAAASGPAGPAVVADGFLGAYAANGRLSYDPPEGLSKLLEVATLDPSRLTAGDIRAGENKLRTERFGTFDLPGECNYVGLAPTGKARAIAWYGREVLGIESAGRRLTWFALPLVAALGSPGCEKLLLPLAESYGIRPPARISGDRIVVQHARSRERQPVLFLFNLERRAARALVEPGGTFSSAEDLLERRPLEVRRGAFEVGIPAGGVKVVRLA